MKINVYNDGKCKHQSYEASFKDTEINEDYDFGFITGYDISDLVGYGANADEAVDNLIKQFNVIIDKLIEVKKSIEDKSIIIEE